MEGWAMARIRGSSSAPGLDGWVRLRQHRDGVHIRVEVRGLPENSSGFFGLHIHEGTRCDGEGFPSTGAHYDTMGSAHPKHAGDLPPLLSCNGIARMQVLTDRFRLQDVIGRTVVIHSDPDDFRSQPAGNAGKKIGCGVIRRE